jgi:hypothetical protein
MASRKDILLVGSVPLANTEAVFRLLASKLAADAKRYPDGETGDRTNWIRWQRHVFDSCKQMQLVDAARLLKGYTDGLARPFYRVNDGINTGDIRLERLGYADVAADSYKIFEKLRNEGIIPPATRFQVSIPTILALLTGFVVKEDRAKVEPALEEVMSREITKLGSAIPHQNLSVQWDAVMEVVGYDGGYDLHYADILEQSIESICKQINFVPKDVEVGIHFCYGDPGHKHVLEPKSTATCVLFANAIFQNAARAVNWIHIPVPRDRSDDSYFSPLKDLKIPSETEIYLGLVHITDGVPGTKNRIRAAERYLEEFGLATECGFGRRPPDTLPLLLDIHRAAGRA